MVYFFIRARGAYRSVNPFRGNKIRKTPPTRPVWAGVWTIQLGATAYRGQSDPSQFKVKPFLFRLFAIPMAAKLVPTPPQLLLTNPSRPSSANKFEPRNQPWIGRAVPKRKLVVSASLRESLPSNCSPLALLQQLHHLPHNSHSSSSLFLLAESVGYSTASYYTSLGLFVISVPGLWSLIKRSVKSKVLFFFFERKIQGTYFLVSTIHFTPINYYLWTFVNPLTDK